MVFLAGFKNRKKITIDNTKVDADINGFPVLISITDTDFQKARADGFDFAFTKADEITEIPYEREFWDDATGLLVAWVKVDVKDATDVDIFIYYNKPDQSTDKADPENVWDSNYKGVFHLTDNVLDSTSNNNDGIDNGTSDIAGQIKDGRDADGVADWIELGTNGLPVKSTSGYSVEFWVKTIGIQNGETPYAEGNSGNDSPIFFFRCISTKKIRVFIRANSGAVDLTADSTTDVFESGFTHVLWTDDNGTGKLYINGVLDATSFNYTPTAITLNNASIFAWHRTAIIQFLEGIMDELRLSNNIRTASYALTSFNNQDSPNTFVTFGAEENAFSLKFHGPMPQPIF